MERANVMPEKDAMASSARKHRDSEGSVGSDFGSVASDNAASLISSSGEGHLGRSLSDFVDNIEFANSALQQSVKQYATVPAAELRERSLKYGWSEKEGKKVKFFLFFFLKYTHIYSKNFKYDI